MLLREDTTAAKALSSLVRMPLHKHGSGKAIEHWRGSYSTPLGQNPLISQPGLSCSKGGDDAGQRQAPG